MAIDKSLLAGSTGLLVLRLLQEEDLYGYQMIERLRERSDDTFSLKAGTLYPLLHTLETQGLVQSYEQTADGARIRKYYHLTDAGHAQLAEKTEEWRTFSGAVDRVLKGGENHAFA
ncbi:MAG: PadR family transcriptional regulator [Agathobaculum sp.]|jgi:PadR family transcriptional regulator PadR|uniref:PadR family transcriptional regulator n=1 Tax=Agathobaculum sp. TaxID=2048138 RepID=UPI003D9020BC